MVAVDDGYEPNNFVAEAYAISYGDIIDARIDPAGDVDYFSFSGTANDTITLDIDAQIDYGIGASDIDSYLELIDSSGSVVLESNDDYNPPGYDEYSLDSRLAYVILAYTGTYFVKVRDLFNEGGPDYTYALSLVKGGAPPPPAGPAPVPSE
ncbi:MAG: pre-peptidase C-terminal domain-containing protein [Candidatus Marinimicrobia bacterium]|nr:pre-peptidase C-terminal domain-containing protein [Candidatus Neomarinimicrobiota bacterium]